MIKFKQKIYTQWDQTDQLKQMKDANKKNQEKIKELEKGNKLKTSKYTHLFIRKVESENGITLPFTYVGIGHLDNPRQSQNEERKRTFIFDIHMEEELPDYLQYDFGLTN